MNSPLDEAREYLRQADQLSAHCVIQPGLDFSQQIERRDRLVLQLHIRAMVAALGALEQQSVER